MKNGRNHQGTPIGAFRWANDRWGPFDLDAAASEWNAKVDRYYDEIDDGLSQRWSGRVWVNPPWSRIEPWIDKAIASVFVDQTADLVCMLLPVRGGRAWFINKLCRYAREVPIQGRLKFEAPPGEETGSGGFEACAYYIFERAPLARELMEDS